MHSAPSGIPLLWNRRLQLFTFGCSFTFALCSLFQGWLVINDETVQLSLRLAGRTAAEAPDLVSQFRVVAAYYVAGNTLGMFALRGSAWSFWATLLINLTQVTGPLGLIPAQVHRAALELHGPVGLVPTVVVCGGALVLTVTLMAHIIPCREIWADLKARQNSR
ncbi:hypothetical protein [Nonomuraea gerenzanensis]|uniref:Uncharacterized protein n=1 Tax=Nonomuraea gerenzanensis TaxID=93944 RepID=A0A1M4E8K5_9ACTN|nr:hypothetical protein [Nonomuraea gerenzanensis]UBU17393.1 hypothetical protein LCN96_20915 [Nonomuraea gerenzanensis]SBO95145.1 hypothetical protein BN4615_P4661 [Nonomuraea gerenzanensis]